MVPTWTLGSLAELDPAFVAAQRVEGIIWDIDGTLTAYHARTLHPRNEAPFRALASLPGLRHVILSNAPEWRFRELSGMFPAIPVLRGYVVGGHLLVRCLLAGRDTWAPGLAEERLAAGARVLRKPDPRLVVAAVAELGCGAAAAVMVGDQHLTDVAGASLAGVRSVKVPTIARETFPLTIRFTQTVERLAYHIRSPRRLPVYPSDRANR